MPNFGWLLLSFLTYAIGYGLGLFNNRLHHAALMEQIEEVREQIEEVRELGFHELEDSLEMDNDPTINDLKRMILESEFSSNDEMQHPNN
jgi:demethoxyubiquinone hydroxylase (CLK1/Coq7/Cat5 family)